MSSFTKSMFESIKQSLETQKGGNGNFRDLLKTEPGNSYIVRLIPNLKNPERTFHHHVHHGWTSVSTGNYVSCTCPVSRGEACPVCAERIKLYRDNTEENKKKAYELKKKENWLVNVYVIDDPKNPDNNGTVKILKYGKQIQKIIEEAMTGEDAEEFGPAIFDLTKNGCSLRVKVEKNEGGFPTYVASKFLPAKAIDGMDADKIKEVQDGIFELDKLFDVQSEAEIVSLLKDHAGLNVKSSTPTVSKPTPEPEEEEEEEEEESVEETSEPEEEENSEEEDEEDEEVEEIDDKISDLLADLD